MKWDRIIPWLYGHDLEIFGWPFVVLVVNGLCDY